jgi:hypothetical protein
MNLRMLHKFDFLPRIPGLRAFPLDDFSTWVWIRQQIRK